MPGRRTSRTIEVRGLADGELQALLAGSRDRHLVALLLEGVLDPARDGELVLDDQDRGSHGPPILHRRPARPGGPRGGSGGRPVVASPRDVRRAAARDEPVPPRDARARRPPHRGGHPLPDRPTLAAASRTVTGKKVARLRRDGRLPAVVFGHGAESEPVSSMPTSSSLLRRHIGASTLVDLAVDGEQGAAGDGPRHPGAPGHPAAAPRRPVRRPDDRGADGRGPARRHRRRPGRRAGRHARAPDVASRSGPCPPTCPRRCTTTSAPRRLRRHDHRRRPRSPRA